MYNMDKITTALQEYVSPEKMEEIQTLVKENKLYLAGSAVLAYGAWKFVTRPRNLPPGPVSLPVIGGAYQLSSNAHLDFIRLGKKYGDVFSVNVFGRVTIVMNSAAAIKESFIKQAEEFAHRQKSKVANDVMELKDEIFDPPYNEEWKHAKKFALTTLRTYGFGTKIGEAKILDQIEQIGLVLSKNGSEPVNPEKVCSRAAACVIFGIVLGKSYNYEDPEFIKVMDNLQTMVDTAMDARMFVVELTYPWLSSLLCGSFKRKLRANTENLRKGFIDIIKDQFPDFDPDNPRSVVDGYIKEKGVDNIDMPRMANNVLAFTGDAIFTLAAVFNLAIGFMAKHQDVQARIQAQLDEVVGTSRKVTTNDKASLPLMDALVMETLRINTPAVITPPREMNADTTFRGYNIPKGALVMANLYAVHFNPEVYKDPHKFDLEHFLNEDGSINRRTDHFVPFGVGRRSCLGEQLTRMELFLLLSNILLRYNITFADDFKVPTEDEDMMTRGVVRICIDYKAKFAPR